MNYRPKDMLMWDAWYWNEQGTVHAFHLQRLRPGATRTIEEERSVGHAVSRDLVHWQELPAAISPGPAGALDDMEIFTGCTYKRGDTYYLFYTMKSSRENGQVQRLALATSKDLLHWEKYPDNPVLTPDPRWYCTEEHPALYGLVDCRDLSIVDAPDGKGYYGFYAARVPSEEMSEGAVIACCYSEDLIHWEQRPPVFRSDKYTIVEVPEVFQLDGKWYMLLLCNNEYGNRELFPDQPEIIMGTIYAVADSVEGPYREPEDNLLLASRMHNGFSCRTVEFQGKRMVLYTSAARLGNVDLGDTMMGVLSTPKELAVRDGKLCALYSPLIESAHREQLLPPEVLYAPVVCRLAYQTPGRWEADGDAITGSVRTAWARYSFNVRARAFNYTASLTMHEGVAAGLAFKQIDNGYGGGIFLLDFEKEMVQLLRIPQMYVMDSRKIRLERGRTYRLRVVAKNEYLEFYVDDVLVMQNVFYASPEGFLGLVVDRGKARFEDIRACRLEIPAEADEAAAVMPD